MERCCSHLDNFFKGEGEPNVDQWMRERDACGIGAVINIDGRPDNKVLDDALSIVEKLEHRAGKDATGKVGDGVGILTQVSHKFFKKAAAKCVFFATGFHEAHVCKKTS